MNLFRSIFLLCALLLTVGCMPPSERLSFPKLPVRSDGLTAWYDVNRNGHPDFGVAPDDAGLLDVLSYDDDEDGTADRVYRLSDYRDTDVPHLILLLDSIGFKEAANHYAEGNLRLFHPPQKVIGPFPSLTEVCYSDVMRAPPLPGIIDQHYDERKNRQHNGLWERIQGYEQPWERRLTYGAKFWENGSSYLNPRGWFGAELERVRQTTHDSPHNVTIAYITSASGMVCKYAKSGSDEVLAGAMQLCLQLLYERRGAIKITLMSDHGHNLVDSKNVNIEPILREAGLRPSKSLRRPNDAVMEINGLVTYAAVQTKQPQRLIETLARRPEVDQVMYQEGDALIVQSAAGKAVIEARDGLVRYRPIDADVLGYVPVLDNLRSRGQLLDDGYLSDNQWLMATLDHEYPDAPRRVWDAFHRQVVQVPRVMFTLKDGYCAGIGAFESFIKMASTHGSLNQVNTSTFVMSMTDRVNGPMRSRDVLATVAPGYEPPVRETDR